MSSWYYASGKQKIGPISIDQLRQLVSAGRLGPTDMILQNGAQKWVPVSTVEGIFPPPAPIYPQNVGPAPALSRSTTTSWIPARALWPWLVGGLALLIVGTIVVGTIVYALGRNRKDLPSADLQAENRSRNNEKDAAKASPIQSKLQSDDTAKETKLLDINRNKDTPPSVPVGEHDPVVASVLGVNTRKYLDNGFKDYTFGTSQDQINKKSALFRQANSDWLINSENEEFLFVDGKLRGFVKVYVGNNEAYLAKLAELLGKTSQTMIFTYPVFHSDRAVMGSFDNTGNSFVTTVVKGNEEMAFYLFPKTLACLRVIQTEQTRADRSGVSKTKDERIALAVVDREWAVTIMDRDFQYQRLALAWLKKATDQITKDGKLQTANLPICPNAHLCKSLPGGQSNPLNIDIGILTRTFLVRGNDAKLDTVNVKPFVIFEDVLQDFPNDGKILKKGTIAIQMNAEWIPDSKPNPLASSVICQMVLLCVRPWFRSSSHPLAPPYRRPQSQTVTSRPMNGEPGMDGR